MLVRDPAEGDAASPPYVGSPHATTVPSLFNAAKALLDPRTSATPDERLPTGAGVQSDTGVHAASPPEAVWPQVTTEPSVFVAAKAKGVDETVRTPEDRAACETGWHVGPPIGDEITPPYDEQLQTTQEPT